MKEKLIERINKRKTAMCDPAVCQFCEYICEGDFICTKDYSAPVLVMADWTPTEDFMRCKRGTKS